MPPEAFDGGMPTEAARKDSALALDMVRADIDFYSREWDAAARSRGARGRGLTGGSRRTSALG
jgi:hypothetical protein